MKVKWQSIITCPHCSFQQEESMPANVGICLWECPQCQTVVKSKPSDCCIFCAYGTVPCPPVQMNAPGNCCGGSELE